MVLGSNWEVHEYLSRKIASKKYGWKVNSTIGKGVKRKYPVLKGFERVGLFGMMQFYETYKDNEIVSLLVSQIYSLVFCVVNAWSFRGWDPFFHVSII